jgi:hypothetical protein
VNHTRVVIDSTSVFGVLFPTSMEAMLRQQVGGSCACRMSALLIVTALGDRRALRNYPRLLDGGSVVQLRQSSVKDQKTTQVPMVTPLTSKLRGGAVQPLVAFAASDGAVAVRIREVANGVVAVPTCVVEEPLGASGSA